MGHAKSFFSRLDKETWSRTNYAAVMVGHIEDYVQNLRLLSLVDCFNLPCPIVSEFAWIFAFFHEMSSFLRIPSVYCQIDSMK